jgi:outer membrane receptor for ferrienterochelin and colicins
MVSREKVIPTGSYDAVFNAPQNRTTDAASYLHLSYEKRFDEDRAIKASLYYNRYSYEGKYLFDNPPVAINRDSAEGRWWGGEARFTERFFRTHKVTAGIEYRDNGRQEQQNYDEQPFALYLSDRRSSHVYAAYLQDEYTIVQNLILNAGVRYDHYDNFGGTTNPRIGLIYSPFAGTTIKAVFGQAFRAPNAYELYYGDGNVTQKPNPGLRPERITTYELILDRYFRNYRFSVAGFYYRTKDLITLTTDPIDNLLVFRNIATDESKGAEANLEGQWRNGIRARFGYTIQRARNVDRETMLSASPQHLVKFNTKIPIFGEKLSSGLELQYTSWQRTPDGDRTGGFLLCNLTLLSRDLVKGVELSGTLYNLLDKKYSNPASGEHRQRAIEQDGISFRFKATARF